MSSQYYSATAYVGTPHRNAVEVTIPLVGPAGPQGPAGEAGAGAVESVNGQTGVVNLDAADVGAAQVSHDHQPNEVYADAVYVSGATLSDGEPNGVYLRDGSDNSKAIYKQANGYSIFWDNDNGAWILGNYAQTNSFFASDGDTVYPWDAATVAPWDLGVDGAGDVPDIEQATLEQIQFEQAKNSITTRTPKTGNAAADEVVLGSDTRLTNSRTPTSHTHGNITNAGLVGTTSGLPLKTGTGGIVEAGAFGTAAGQFAEGNHTHTLSAITDAGTAAAQDADQDLGTTDDVTHRSVTVVGDPIEGQEGSFNKGLFSGNALELGPYTDSGPIDEPPYIELTNLGGGVTKVTGSASPDTTRLVGLPNASGTLALTSDFAAPPAIGNTTAAAGSFSTLTSTDAGRTATLQGISLTLQAGSALNPVGIEAIGNVANSVSLFVGSTRVLSAASGGIISLVRDATLRWRANTGGPFGGTELELGGEGANILSQRNAANPQTFRIYNTFTSATNFERLNLRWASNELIIDAEAGSAGGTLRGIKIGSASTSLLGFYGATPVVQQAAVADATDAASTQDRLNDLLARLRTLGLIAT
jgi:hypothetical protein